MFLIDLQSVGMNFLNIIYFIVALVVLVMVHEFGHFITAKMFNVYVSEFSIGFGPLIFKKKKGETEYSLRAIPFGGYCALAGENLEDAANYKDIPPERFLCGIKKWKRAIIMIADSVEAASRSMNVNDRDALIRLVDKIIKDKREKKTLPHKEIVS